MDVKGSLLSGTSADQRLSISCDVVRPFEMLVKHFAYWVGSRLRKLPSLQKWLQEKGKSIQMIIEGVEGGGAYSRSIVIMHDVIKAFTFSDNFAVSKDFI